MNNDEKSYLQMKFTATIHSICSEAEELGIIPHEATCNIIDIIMNYVKKECEVKDENN